MSEVSAEYARIRNAPDCIGLRDAALKALKDFNDALATSRIVKANSDAALRTADAALRTAYAESQKRVKAYDDAHAICAPTLGKEVK